MAQAQPDIYASAEDRASLEEGEIRTTAWSGATHHISSNTFSHMERELERICWEERVWWSRASAAAKSKSYYNSA